MTVNIYNNLQGVSDSFRESQEKGENFSMLDALEKLSEGMNDDNSLAIRWMNANAKSGKTLKQGLEEIGVVVEPGEGYGKRLLKVVGQRLREMGWRPPTAQE